MSYVNQTKSTSKDLNKVEPEVFVDKSFLKQTKLDTPQNLDAKNKIFTKQNSLISVSSKVIHSMIKQNIDENTQVEPKRHIFEWKNIFTLIYTVLYGFCCILVYVFRSKTVKEPVPTYNYTSKMYEFKCAEGRSSDNRFDFLLLTAIVILWISVLPLIISFLKVHQHLEKFLNKYFECHCSRPVYFIIGLILIFTSNFLHLIANFLGDQEQHGRYFCSLQRPITAESRRYGKLTFSMSWTTNIAILIIHTFGQPFLYFILSRSNKIKYPETNIDKLEIEKLNAIENDSKVDLTEVSSKLNITTDPSKTAATSKLSNVLQSQFVEVSSEKQ